MKKIILIFFGLILINCSSESENGNSTNNNGFTVNDVFYPTPVFTFGAITERPDRGFDIYEFYFTDNNGSTIHIDINSPNLDNLEEMTYPILNEDGRLPGISLLRKNGVYYPNKDEDYYYSASTNYNNGFIKVYRENGKLVFEYEFNYYDNSKSIRGYAKQP